MLFHHSSEDDRRAACSPWRRSSQRGVRVGSGSTSSSSFAFGSSPCLQFSSKDVFVSSVRNVGYTACHGPGCLVIMHAFVGSFRRRLREFVGCPWARWIARSGFAMSNWVHAHRRQRLRMAMLTLVHVWVLVLDVLAVSAPAWLCFFGRRVSHLEKSDLAPFICAALLRGHESAWTSQVILRVCLCVLQSQAPAGTQFLCIHLGNAINACSDAKHDSSRVCVHVCSSELRSQVFVRVLVPARCCQRASQKQGARSLSVSITCMQARLRVRHRLRVPEQLCASKDSVRHCYSMKYLVCMRSVCLERLDLRELGHPTCDLGGPWNQKPESMTLSSHHHTGLLSLQRAPLARDVCSCLQHDLSSAHAVS